MYARMFTAYFQPDTLDEVPHIVPDLIVPVVKLQKGYKSFVLTNPTTSKGVIVSMWATEVDRDASEANGFLRAQIAKLGALVASPPVVERYEIAIRSS